MLAVRDHRLDALLHRGRHADVWAATRLGPGGFETPVALKILNATAAATPAQVRAFLAEASTAAAVSDRNVVQVRELICEHGSYAFSMERVRGWPLRALLASTSARHRVPIAIAIALVRDAARGLQAVHEAGLVHRHVTPDNLMIGRSGEVIVIDFGGAIPRGAIPPAELLDPIYASPLLRTHRPVDGRIDTYSLGALLDALIPRSPEVPLALRSIIARAIDPERTFVEPQALEVALDLVSIREGWLVPPAYVAAYASDLARRDDLEGGEVVMLDASMMRGPGRRELRLLDAIEQTPTHAPARTRTVTTESESWDELPTTASARR
ncbi:MAG: protein kinase [Deltaproteobacteria bacterium]|nr:protein kinase [Deltaproteobacteria bacterium]